MLRPGPNQQYEKFIPLKKMGMVTCNHLDPILPETPARSLHTSAQEADQFNKTFPVYDQGNH